MSYKKQELLNLRGHLGWPLGWPHHFIFLCCDFCFVCFRSVSNPEPNIGCVSNPEPNIACVSNPEPNIACVSNPEPNIACVSELPFLDCTFVFSQVYLTYNLTMTRKGCQTNLKQSRKTDDYANIYSLIITTI